jgi:hypothetical protein
MRAGYRLPVTGYRKKFLFSIILSNPLCHCIGIFAIDTWKKLITYFAEPLVITKLDPLKDLLIIHDISLTIHDRSFDESRCQKVPIPEIGIIRRS